MGRETVQPAMLATRNGQGRLSIDRNWTDDCYFEQQADAAEFIVFEDGSTEGTVPALFDILANLQQ